jgi:hypothetical protein
VQRYDWVRVVEVVIEWKVIMNGSRVVAGWDVVTEFKVLTGLTVSAVWQLHVVFDK